jgi:predicted ArsR family transcriptional regulator
VNFCEVPHGARIEPLAELRHNGVVKYVSAPSVADVRAASVDAPTRRRVATALLENGPSTAADLAQRLSLTPAAVRRHVDSLVAAGLVEQRSPRAVGARGRGRPAKYFALTDSGRDTFAQAYDDLAVSALRFLSEAGGPDAVAAFARRRTAELAARYRATVEAASTPAERAQALATALAADGYAASVRSAPVGEQICQHHCPVAHVAAEFPELCAAETEVFGRLLGRHVQRLATIAHGDGVCTTNLPGPQPFDAAHPAPLNSATATPTGRTSS